MLLIHSKKKSLFKVRKGGKLYDKRSLKENLNTQWSAVSSARYPEADGEWTIKLAGLPNYFLKIQFWKAAVVSEERKESLLLKQGVDASVTSTQI